MDNTSSKIQEAKLIELKVETDNSTIIVEDFSALLIVTDRTTRQKIGEDIQRRHEHTPSPHNPLEISQPSRKEGITAKAGCLWARAVKAKQRASAKYECQRSEDNPYEAEREMIFLLRRTEKRSWATRVRSI